MSEPEICSGCPTEGRIKGVEPIIDHGFPVGRIIKPCDSYPYNASINNPERYGYCQKQLLGTRKE